MIWAGGADSRSASAQLPRQPEPRVHALRKAHVIGWPHRQFAESGREGFAERFLRFKGVNIDSLREAINEN